MSTKSVRDGIAQIEAVMRERVGECHVIVSTWSKSWAEVRRGEDTIAESASFASKGAAVRDLARILGVTL